MNRLTIRTEVRDIIGEDSADFWTDAELNRHINEGLKRWTGENRWSYLLTESTGQLLAGDADYQLTEGVADYRHLNIMLTRDGDTRPYLAKRVSPARGFRLRQAYYTPQSYPTWFYVTSAVDVDNDGVFITTIKFIPEPTNNVDLEFQHYRTPEPLDADLDVPDMPLAYHKALVHFAAGTAWLKELSAGQKAQEQFSLYDAIVREAQGDEESAADDEVLVWGGDTPEVDTLPVSSEDYALRRIAATLGP
jgi:hypothetical protein